MTENNNIINLYYGTKNLELDFKYKIDPDFDGGKIFEFGNGFYLTPNKDLAESYAKHNSLIELAAPKNRPSLDILMKGIIVSGHLHIYELDYNNFKKNTNVKEFESIKDYRNVLKETLDGYNENINYRPNRDATFGEICGQFWDDYWDEGNSNRGKLSHDELIEKCIEEMKKNAGKRERQICIHKTKIGPNEQNIFDEFLKKVDCKEITL
ncbi:MULTISPECIES: DUF3990 domain-containing protein [Clostridium]|uniref:DUF3990 domain-containing protein n=1 Tax=Clostridium TaxID=1485 RepID=UPI0002D1D241|nr:MULTISPECIES: DUF3990 domain-containing protein [Clostridium]ENZ30557.1 hypothetical protein HMPREF1084_03711 [Clostridium butyricum 60E.3]KQB76780.1 hypothetical protein AK964_21300 [Clostridium butyricum]MBS4843242.1 DUF3990 domain-containing protein [Clostridium sp.]MDB2162449.1 DUF3990 domain-containing protein [Clostridium butyricum]MDU5105041.1 DUF3990 domain-containing protein [Clostridium butyricum]